MAMMDGLSTVVDDLQSSDKTYGHPPEVDVRWGPTGQPLQDTFQNLLEAAASEYGQNRGQDEGGAAYGQHRGHDEGSVAFLAGGSSKRRLDEDEDEDEDAFATEAAAASPRAKRLRTTRSGPGKFATSTTARESPLGPVELSKNGTSAVAAALFRPATAASEKYTRPPMAKIFDIMDLAPEEFLDIQAAAKVYMLDESHPERAEAVGNKTRGDTDLTKLRLFACVKGFLEDQGWGEHCWGQRSINAEHKRLKWPHMKNKIISALTPLMRRMVTNERQRMYARQARQSKKAKPRASPTTLARTPRDDEDAAAFLAGPVAAEIDPKLDDYHYEIGGAQHAVLDLEDPSHAPLAAVHYLVRCVDATGKLTGRLDLEATSCPDYGSLWEQTSAPFAPGTSRRIRALLPTGLQTIQDDASLQDARATVARHAWMDGQLRLLVETTDPDDDDGCD